MSGKPLFEELALAGPEHLDPEYVAGYDRKAQFDPAGDLDDLRSRGLGPTSTLIDFGAGTGAFALAAASLCGRASLSMHRAKPHGRVARAGGILRLRDLVFSFDLREAEARIADWIDAVAAQRPEDGWTREELATHVREEYSTFGWLLEPMIERAGFEVFAADYGTLGTHADYVCVKQGR